MTGVGGVTAGALMGTGTITVNGSDSTDQGRLTVTGAFGFSGTILIDSDGFVEIGTTVTGGGTFDFQASSGTVEFDTATTSSDTFDGFTTGDKIQVRALTFASGDRAVWQQTAGDSGTLSAVNGSGATLATFDLSGQFSTSDFSVFSAGGGNGTVIECVSTEPAFVWVDAVSGDFATASNWNPAERSGSEQ